MVDRKSCAGQVGCYALALRESEKSEPALKLDMVERPGRRTRIVTMRRRQRSKPPQIRYNNGEVALTMVDLVHPEGPEQINSTLGSDQAAVLSHMILGFFIQIDRGCDA
jgi:hypothetical protein